MVLTHAWRGAGAAHNGTGPRGVSCRWGWVCETWGRGGGRLQEQREETRSENKHETRRMMRHSLELVLK